MYYDYNKKQLVNVVSGLDDAIDSYIQGDIHITKHILQEILSAIKQYERDMEKGAAI